LIDARSVLIKELVEDFLFAFTSWDWSLKRKRGGIYD
jgi:hypothetical protein